MPSVPTYLMSRNGIWYFNYRIPSFLRNRYNIQKLFIRKSLRTTNVREAIKVSRKYTCLVMDNNMGNKKPITGRMKISGQFRANDQERKLRELEDDQEILNDALVIGRKIAEEYKDAFNKGKRHEQIDFWKQYSEYEYECYRYAVDKNNEEQERIRADRKQRFEEAENRFVKKIAGEMHVTVSSEVGTKSEVQKTSITLSELIEAFIKHKSGTWNDRSLKLQKGRLRVISEFLEFAIGIENPMIHQFESEQAIMFEEEFYKFPKNCKKKFPDMSVTDVMNQIDSVKFTGVDRIATNNYNEYAGLLMAVFRWAKTDKKRKYLAGENPFVELKKDREPYKSYSPFTNDEIKLFFGSKMFKKKKFEEKFAWRYWIPIIMMYHGMRLEEVAQLQVKNIFKSNGVWCFDLRDEFDAFGGVITITKKRGKESGERVVPIHPKVIDLGFLDYVTYQKGNGSNKVFPTLRNRNEKGEYKPCGSGVTAWFNEDSKKEYKRSYFTEVGIDKKSRNLVLYSFKHSAETLLINHPDTIEHDKIDTMIGHLVNSTGRKHYGKYNEQSILEVVEKIEYPEAELPWNVNPEYHQMPFPWCEK